MPWDCIGHAWAADILREHVARGTQRQAYLFTGPPGTGRRTVALRFIQALLCQQPPEPGVPCGTCRACQQVERRQHPDLFVVEKLPEKTEVLIDQVRALQHDLSLAPYEGRYRFGLLTSFDQASEGAMNALLKLLEEPPSRAILILTAETPEALRRTIVSRCEVFRLRPVPLSDLAGALTERCQLSPENARLYAHLSSGRPGYALRLHANPALLTQRRAWLDDLLRLVKATRLERFEYAAQATDNSRARGRAETYEARGQLRNLLLNWLSFWSDVMLCTANVSVPLINLDYETEISRLAAPLDLLTARRAVLSIETTLRQLDANVTPRLAVEVMLLDWPVLPV